MLSRGHLSTPPPSPPHEAGAAREGGNRRNFYRVLQVQPGAPEPLIDASYRVLVAAPDAPVDLLEEAYATLKDPRLRAAYDESLETGKAPPADSRPPKSTPYASPPEVAARPASRLDTTGYEPLITGYCAFCKTPHGRGSGLAEDAQCAECASPLSPPTLSGLQPAGRTLERMNGDDPLDYYVYWPGERMCGRLNDLSPSGMRFTVPHALGLGQVIKVDAPRLQATGEVAHARVQSTYTEVGLKFLTVQFTRAQGTFLSAKA